MISHRHSSIFTRVLLGLFVLTFASANSGHCQTSASDKEQELIAVLSGDAPKSEKALACKSLTIYGSDAAVPELAKLLSDPQLASWARIPLEAIPGPAANEALRDACESLQGNLLIGAINSLGVRRDAGALELLTVQLHSADVRVASAAAAALGQIGNDAASNLLRETLADAQGPLRSSVAEACILCAERRLNDGDFDEAIEIYDEVRSTELPKQRIIEATRGSILARQDAGIPPADGTAAIRRCRIFPTRFEHSARNS